MMHICYPLDNIIYVCNTYMTSLAGFSTNSTLLKYLLHPETLGSSTFYKYSRVLLPLPVRSHD